MGAYVSVSQCASNYNVTLNCNITDGAGNPLNANGTFDGVWPDDVMLGGLSKGEFPSNSDIAGIGILAVFVAVTSFALAVSLVDVLWQASKTFKWKSRKKDVSHISFSDVLEDLVLTCSDQQVFIGAAYALTLRYLTGCTVSAYHYNVVANMLLLTCATHLMSVTIVRNYWKYPWLSLIRIISISGVFIVTGLLFTNQNADSHMFPTGIPPWNETTSLLFLEAACFEPTASGTFQMTFQQSTKNPHAFFQNTIVQSTPGNKIHGWNWYVITLLYYGAAIIVEAIRFIRRSARRKGWRGRLGEKARRCSGSVFVRKLVEWFFLVYLFGGVAIGAAVVVEAASYIFRLRAWVDKSGWIEMENGVNPENDFSSFGQSVPIITSALIIFSFLQIISDKTTKHGNRKHADEEARPQIGTIQYLDPSNYDLLSGKPTPRPDHHLNTTTNSSNGPPPPPEKPGAAAAAAAATGYFDIIEGKTSTTTTTSPPPPRIHLDHQFSFGSEILIPNTTTPAPGASTPMLTSSAAALDEESDEHKSSVAAHSHGGATGTTVVPVTAVSDSSIPQQQQAAKPGSDTGAQHRPVSADPDPAEFDFGILPAVSASTSPAPSRDLTRFSWLPSPETPADGPKPDQSR